MPNENNVWLIASPLDSNPADMADELNAKLDPSGALSLPGTASTQSPVKGGKNKLAVLGTIDVPEFKTTTLSGLLNLSDVLAKQDSVFLSITSKIVDTIRSLDPNEYTNNTLLDDGRPLESYLLDGWSWNRAKYRAENRPLQELVDSFISDMNSIDSIQKKKTADYNLVKGQLVQLQRKQTGTLATRDLSRVVDKDDIPAEIKNSEYLDIVYVAVNKNNAKDWENKYERLTQFVVPRSSTKIASDDEYNLYTATVFKRVKDEFAQKCREEKFTVRDFNYDEAAIIKQAKELQDLEASEKDLWADLVRISRINYSESVELVVHLKIVRAYVESLLRYGLPAHYFYAFVKPDPRNAKKLLSTLSTYFKPFTPALKKANSSSNDNAGDASLGEFANILEQELFDFVLFEVPLVDRLDS